MDITYEVALKDTKSRQSYLDELVEMGGGKPDFVDSYRYVSNDEMRAILA